MNSKLTVLSIALLFFIFSCGDPNRFNHPQSKMKKDLNAQLENYVDNFLEIPSAWLYVQVGSEQAVSLAANAPEVEKDDFINIESGFRTASVTKMFTAVIIIQLAESRQLSLSDPVNRFLSDELLEGLHGQADLSNLTIENLLQHTSGIEDYVQLDWINTLTLDPQRFWRPLELLDHVKDNGNPIFSLGTDFYYSDTNYVLLGLIIEEITELELHEVYDMMILEPLGLHNTFLEAYNLPSTYEPTSGYFDASELTLWSTSSDWGGGGLVSDIFDLGDFMRALVNEDLFEDRASWRSMQKWVVTGSQSKYGLGIGEYQILGNTVIGHGGQGFGFTSSLYYYPDKDAIIVLAVNQQATDIIGFEEAVIQTINSYY